MERIDMSDQPESLEPLELLNQSELLQILKSPERGGHRLRKAVPADRLTHLIRTGEQPDEKEIALTTNTRQRLQVWVRQNWNAIGSQLPCSGETRGKCTEHPCTEGKHLDCYNAAEDLMI